MMLGKPQGAGYCNLTAKDPEAHRAHMIRELDYISRSAWSDLCDQVMPPSCLAETGISSETALGPSPRIGGSRGKAKPLPSRADWSFLP